MKSCKICEINAYSPFQEFDERVQAVLTFSCIACIMSTWKYVCTAACKSACMCLRFRVRAYTSV